MPSKVARDSAANSEGEREHLSACAPQDARHTLVRNLVALGAHRLDLALTLIAFLGLVGGMVNFVKLTARG
jgi:hypothetical protein